MAKIADLEAGARPNLSREDSLASKLLTRSPIVTALCQAMIVIPLGVCALYFGVNGMKADYTLSSIDQDLLDHEFTADDIPDSLTDGNQVILPEYEDTYCYDLGRFLAVSGAVYLFNLVLILLQYKVVSEVGPNGVQDGLQAGGLGIVCCTYCLYILSSLFGLAWWIYGMVLIFGDYKPEQSVCEDVFDHKDMVLYAKIHVLLPLGLFGLSCVLLCCVMICGGALVAGMG